MALPVNPDWLVPDWPAPAGVRALCSSRAGGSSLPPFDSFNLGDHVGDDPAAVRLNRAQFARLLAAEPVFLSQVHGCAVAELSVDTAPGTVADACLTRQPGVACTIMVADCLPVLFCHARGGVVAAAHAGWRGLAGQDGWGVLENTFKHFSALAQMEHALSATESVANDTLVWLGPCIGAQQFEVGNEVRQAFVESCPQAAALFTAQAGGPPGKWLADLQGLARLRLQAMGISRISGNNGSPGWCTASNPSRFFSHRRDSRQLGGSGRFAACVWLD